MNMTFAQYILQELRMPASSAEPMAELEYRNELVLKNAAFLELWKASGLSGRPEAVVAAPMPRKYRTTTKRRVAFHEQRGLSLDFADRPVPGVCAQSKLEPDNHNQLYQFLFDKLSTPAYVPLARALNWIIIRGSYKSCCVILNVYRMDATVVRKAKQIAELLQPLAFGVSAAMMYYDPTRSDYYLEAERPDEGLESKHLFRYWLYK